MSKVFISSDWHYNHGNIIKYSRRDEFLSSKDRDELDRLGGKWDDNIEWDGEGDKPIPWKITQESIDNMNNHIVNTTNSMVARNDTLYYLGDWAFGQEKYKVSKELRDRINCQNIYFVWGNHDNRSINDLFNGCYDILETKINHQKVVLCHYAFAVWNKSHHKAWNLYGHSHATMEPWLDNTMPGRRSMDVGIDNAKILVGEYRPFAFEEIAKMFSGRNGHFPDHHNQNTT